MPVIDKLVVNEDQRATSFSHDNEIGKPHYYKVTLDNQLVVEISPSERGAHLRFTFPKGHTSYLVLDGYTGLSGVKIYPEQKMITGYVNNGRGMQKGWKNYFVAYFDQPFEDYGTWENEKNTITPRSKEAEGKGRGAYIQFKEGAKVQVKVASSYISEAQAQLNLKKELGSDASLEATKAKAATIWNKHLERILVEGDSEDDKATFYSCFFRASLFSRAFYEIDENGKPYYFSPYDGKVHSGYMFTDTGFWDTFRAQFPLNII